MVTDGTDGCGSESLAVTRSIVPGTAGTVYSYSVHNVRSLVPRPQSIGLGMSLLCPCVPESVYTIPEDVGGGYEGGAIVEDHSGTHRQRRHKPVPHHPASLSDGEGGPRV